MTKDYDRVILKSLPWQVKYKNENYPSFSDKFAFIGKRHIHGSDEIFIVRKYRPGTPGNNQILVQTEPISECQAEYKYNNNNSLTFDETKKLIDYVNKKDSKLKNINYIVIDAVEIG